MEAKRERDTERGGGRERDLSKIRIGWEIASFPNTQCETTERKDVDH